MGSTDRHFFSGVIITAVTCLWALTASAQQSQIMPLGVFHFANPGLDLVQTEQINVLTPSSQAYLERLTVRLVEFSPTHVLLECEDHEAQEINEKFQQYRNANFTLEANEIYQLGFRVGKGAGLETLHCYDTMSVPWSAEALFEYMDENDPEAQSSFMKLIEEYSAEIAQDHQTMSLQELLLKHNDPEYDRQNKSLYLMTNAMDAGGSYVGADATASWWHRNFRMYGNIQQLAEPGTRLLVIGGQGHTALLKDFIEMDSDAELVDVAPYLRD